MAEHTTDSPAPEGLRLNRALAMAGVCSRRQADERIKAGDVRVNGARVSEPGARIDPARDRVEVDGRVLSIPVPGLERHRYVVLNKPVQVVTTASDPQGRATVFDLLPADLRTGRLVHAGRLDFMSQGLLLLTSDGELVHRLTHARYHLDKIYRVRVRGDVSQAKLDAMRRGMTLAEGEKLAPVRVDVAEAGERDTVLEMTLVQGVNRQIRRMCRDLDLTVLRLERTAMGPLSLGRLKPGAWRDLTDKETAALRKAVGLKPAEIRAMTPLLRLGALLGLLLALALPCLAADGAQPVPAERETLRFLLKWGPFWVGSAELTSESGSEAGRDVRRFAMAVRSRLLIDLFYKVRDTVEGVATRDMSHSLRFAKHISEPGLERRFQVEYDPTALRAERTEPGREPVATAIPDHVLDPLSAFHALRFRPCSPGAEHGVMVSDGRSADSMAALVLDTEQAGVQAGTFRTIKVRMRLPELDGVFRTPAGATLLAWVTDDAMRLPVRLSCPVLVGGFQGHMEAELAGVERAP